MKLYSLNKNFSVQFSMIETRVIHYVLLLTPFSRSAVQLPFLMFVAFRCRMIRDYNRIRDDMIFQRLAAECIGSLCDFLGLDHRFNINAPSVKHQFMLSFAEMIG